MTARIAVAATSSQVVPLAADEPSEPDDDAGVHDDDRTRQHQPADHLVGDAVEAPGRSRSALHDRTPTTSSGTVASSNSAPASSPRGA